MTRLAAALLMFCCSISVPTGALYAALLLNTPASYSHQDRLARIAAPARARLAPYFNRAGLTDPPARVVLVALKRERLLRLYAASPGQGLRYVRDYRVVGTSGRTGPKLGEGDGQVPEGIYDISYLNPNSVAYLSLKVSYPNAFDRQMAARDGRAALGGDIMIHGPTRATRGCLALSRRAIEEIYTAVADAGVDGAKVIISPTDFGTGPPPAATPAWTGELYAEIAVALDALPSPLETWRLAEAETR